MFESLQERLGSILNGLTGRGALSESDVTAALRTALAELPHTAHIEVEVDRLDQIEPVLAASTAAARIGTIMLDNFSLDDLRAGVAQVAGRATVEASGGVSLETVAAIAATGVDVISVGALTHSARALDLGLDARIARGDGGAATASTPAG